MYLFIRLSFFFKGFVVVVDGFLCCLKCFKFIRSYLFIFAFVSFALGGISKITLALIYVQECSAYIFF